MSSCLNNEVKAIDRWQQAGSDREVPQDIARIVGSKVDQSDRWGRRTLGTEEGTAVRALLQRLVELGGESGVGDTGEVVVGLHVFLDGLTAVSGE